MKLYYTHKTFLPETFSEVFEYLKRRPNDMGPRFADFDGTAKGWTACCLMGEFDGHYYIDISPYKPIWLDEYFDENGKPDEDRLNLEFGIWNIKIEEKKWEDVNDLLDERIKMWKRLGIFYAKEQEDASSSLTRISTSLGRF